MLIKLLVGSIFGLGLLLPLGILQKSPDTSAAGLGQANSACCQAGEESCSCPLCPDCPECCSGGVCGAGCASCSSEQSCCSGSGCDLCQDCCCDAGCCQSGQACSAGCVCACAVAQK